MLFLATSNVSGAIDVAFLDRADVKLFVGPPPERARYDILASVLVELRWTLARASCWAAGLRVTRPPLPSPSPAAALAL